MRICSGTRARKLNVAQEAITATNPHFALCSPNSRVSVIPLTVNHKLNHTITVSFMRLTAPPQNLIMASEQPFPGSLLVSSLLYEDVPQENYTISVLLWLHMCPCHVAFEDIETIRKFPKPQEVTYSLIIEKIKSSSLCINTVVYMFANFWAMFHKPHIPFLYCNPVYHQQHQTLAIKPF